jgi:1,4-dihydroxy-2-naphthoyl-CoA hydrolase
MLTYTTTIKLHETDAAGLLFFSHQFKIMHDAYEALLEALGIPFASLIRKKDYFLPIVHAESDYKFPLFVGDRITVEVRVKHLGTTSFTLGYTIKKDKKRIVGAGKTVHVTVNKKSHTKIPLPLQLQRAFMKFS